MSERRRGIPPQMAESARDEKEQKLEQLRTIVGLHDQVSNFKRQILESYKNRNIRRAKQLEAHLLAVIEDISGDFDEIINQDSKWFALNGVIPFERQLLQAKADYQANRGRFSENFLNRDLVYEARVNAGKIKKH